MSDNKEKPVGENQEKKRNFIPPHATDPARPKCATTCCNKACDGAWGAGCYCCHGIEARGRTPEPWLNGGESEHSTETSHEWNEIPEGSNQFVALLSSEDYDRAVACVNACAGMKDPAAEIGAMRNRLAGFTPSEEAEAFAGDLAAVAREKIEALSKALLEYDEVLRSAHAIAQRDGESTQWESFRNRVAEVLRKHHALRNGVARG